MNYTLQLPTDEYTAVFSRGGCPICQLRSDRERGFIRTVLNDWVIAAMVRATFIDALGYCPTHAWLQQATEWQSQHDGMTTADMYRYLLLWNLDGLEMFTWLSRYVLKFQQLFPFARRDRPNGSNKSSNWLQPTSHPRGDLPAGLTVKGQCPICEVGQQAERFRLRGFGERLASPEFQAGYAASDGLCLPHFNLALEEVHDAQLREFLIQTALEKLADTAGRLSALAEQLELAVTPKPLSWTQRQTFSRAITQLVGNRASMPPSSATHSLPRSLDAALALDVCPLCALIATTRQDYLKQALHGASIEGQLCHDHLWQLYDAAVEQSDRAGVATIVRQWVDRALEQIKAGDANSETGLDRANGQWPGRIRPLIKIKRRKPVKQGAAIEPSQCPVCRDEAAVQAQNLANFLQWLRDVEVRHRYAQSHGLCMPHLRAALQTAAPLGDRLFLAMTARDRLARLIHQVEEYERKHIWNYREEPKLPEEQTSWIRAVAFEVGERV